MYKHFIKRIMDVIFATLTLVILSPVMILTMLALLISHGKNPFFVQNRPGKNERIFKIIKFKTMNDDADSEGNPLPDGERLTTLGKIIRKTSIDELPQLINILKGEMSFVGPRPLLPEYLELYDAAQKRRHEVRPGITGLAQIHGRNKMLFSEKLKTDVYYVDHLSFILDFKIILQTFITIFLRYDTVINAQDLETVDDLYLTRNLKGANKRTIDEYKRQPGNSPGD